MNCMAKICKEVNFQICNLQKIKRRVYGSHLNDSESAFHVRCRFLLSLMKIATVIRDNELTQNCFHFD